MSLPEVTTTRLGRALRAAGRDFPDMLSLLVFFGVTWLLFRSWQFALVVTASLGFHEMGHACALIWFGLDWRIHFGLVGAWTWSSAEQRARLSQLSNAIIHLLGPFFSMALALAALMFHQFYLPNDRHLLILANFSAQVGFLNLLPLGPVTDGGKIIQRMMTSLDARRYRRVAWLPTLLTLNLLGLYALVQYQRMSQALLAGLLLVGLWLTSSMLQEALAAGRHPTASQPVIPVTGSPATPRPMTVPQVIFLTLMLWDMLALYLIIVSITPFWLEPDYVRGSLDNVVAVLRWLLRLG